MTLTDRIARAICRETCAFKGEPACWMMDDDFNFPAWPNSNCNEPGCHALAEVIVVEIKDELK